MKHIQSNRLLPRHFLKIPQKMGLFVLFFALAGLAGLSAQGMLDKLKQKIEEKSKQKADQEKKGLLQKTKSALDQKLEEIRADYDSSTFSFAIAFGDNAGLFEDKERAKKMQRALISMTDASGLTKDQSTDPLKQAKTYLELGQFSYANNKFKRAELFFKQSQQEFESQGSLQNLYYPKLLTNFGLLYQTMGRYTEAIEYTQKGLAMRAQTEGENSTNYAVSLNNLAMLYRSLGQYNEAEAHLDQALKIIEKTETRQSTTYAILLNNKGMLYQTTGRYPQAEALLKEATQTAKETMRENSNNYQRMLVNLALLYQDQKRYEEAETIYNRAITLKERRLGNRNHPDLAHMLNLLASLYVEMGKYDKVEGLLQEALRIYEKKFGPSHPSYATSASNLGNFYRVQNQIDQAAPLLEQALKIRLETLGEQHPDVAKSQEDMAIYYWQKQEVAQASALYRQVLAKTESFIRTYFPPMSESEKEKYWDKLRLTFLRFYSFAIDFKDQDPSLLTDMYRAHINSKAILLASTNKIKESIMQSNDPALIAEYQAWVDGRESLAHFYTYSQEELSDEGINIDSLEQAVNAKEKTLSQRVPELFESQKEYKDIVAALTATEAAVDILSFPHYDRQFTDQTFYAFLIADKAHPNQPQMVVIENGNELDDKFFKYYRNMVKALKPDKYSYEKYWASVDALLKGKTTIYASLDGVYNQISLYTLQKPDGKYLVDEQSFVFLTNIKDLLGLKNTTTPASVSKQVMLVGFPTYGSQGKISPLPGTKVEVDNIEKIMKTAGFQTQKLTAEQAQEAKVKAVEKPRILHVATHGYFLADPVSTGNNKVFGIDLDKARENSLLKGGILLANAEGALEGENARQRQNQDNGVLTAFEVSTMRLEGTEMVIMSACETGQGDVKAGEGVYGLQRAFQIAGAKAVIMSLWTVSDQATQELMSLFYKNYVQTKDKVKAFKQAQQQLKLKFKEPYYWGAFVMVGA